MFDRFIPAARRGFAWIARLAVIATAFLGCTPALGEAKDNSSPARLKVGAAAVELRGDDAMPIAGGIGPGKATGQEGLLRAVATVIQGPPNGTRIALVALDILMIRRDYLDAAAKEVERRTGIPFGSVIINCTHTHHAPSTVKIHGYEAARR